MCDDLAIFRLRLYPSPRLHRSELRLLPVSRRVAHQ